MPAGTPEAPRESSSGLTSLTGAGKVAAALGQARAETLEAQALARAWLPGRMQYVPPLARSATESARANGESPGQRIFFPCASGWPPLLLDGAHNGHGLAALGQSLAQAGIAPVAVIFSCLIDKNPEDMLPLLRALATGPIYVPPIRDNARAALPADLAAAIGLNAMPVATLTEALEKACAHMLERLPEAFAGERPRNPVLICGSLYLLAELYALRPDCLERPAGHGVF